MKRLLAAGALVLWAAIGWGVFSVYSSDLDRFEADRPPQPRELVLTEVQRQELRHLLGRIEERCAQLIHEAAGRPAEQEALEKACREDLLRAEQRYLERIAARDR